MKISNSPFNRHFCQPWMKIWHYESHYESGNSLFIFKRIEMTTSQVRFRWTDDKLINLIKGLQEIKNSMEFRNCDSNANKVKLYESTRKGQNRYI